MPTLLRIDASSRVQGSHSRDLADFLQTQWLAKNPEGKLVVRDIIGSPIPHILDTTIAAYYTPVDVHTPELKAAVALSDELIAELLESDTILISVPIYNFGVPSSLKAYIDHVIRVGQTFTRGEGGLVGLVKGKNAYITASYGASGYVGGPLSDYNFVEPYLKVLLGFIGISETKFFSVEGASGDPEAFKSAVEAAKAAITAAFAE